MPSKGTILIAVLFLLLLLGYGAWEFSAIRGPGAPAPTPGTPPPPQAKPVSYALEVHGDRKDGKIVIKTAILEKPGTIIIRRYNGDVHGEIIASSGYLEAKEYSDLTIGLFKNETVKAGEVLLAQVLLDDGNKKFGQADITLLAKSKEDQEIKSRFTVK